MVIEKESERPALKLCDEHTECERFWAVYAPEYREFGNDGNYYGIDRAERFDTFEAAQKARRQYGYPARVAFVEIETRIHFNENEGGSDGD